MRLNGSLDKSTSFILDDAINNVVNKAGIKYLLINFEKLYKIDNYGITTIINSYNKYFKNNGKLMICGFNNKVTNTINNSKLITCASIIRNEMSAFNVVNI